MEVKPSVDKLGSTKDLIIESFMASRGSLQSQALFMQGLALYNKSSYQEVSEIFEQTINNFTSEDLKDIFKAMGKGHQNNQAAKDRTAVTIRDYKEKPRNVLLQNVMPSKISILTIWELAESRGWSEPQINEILLKIWEGDSEKRVARIQYLSAALGLYGGEYWFQEMPSERKKELVDKGKELLEKGL